MENPVELSPQQIAALDRLITPPRMSTYRSAAAGDTRLARELYLWDRAVSVGFLADLAILEVALRNSMSTQLERKWGAEWYANTDIPLDDRSSSALNTAWRRVSGPKTPGKLVAQCTFGFWRGLLDKGDHAGRGLDASDAITKSSGEVSSINRFRAVANKHASMGSVGTVNTP